MQCRLKKTFVNNWRKCCHPIKSSAKIQKLAAEKYLITEVKWNYLTFLVPWQLIKYNNQTRTTKANLLNVVLINGHFLSNLTIFPASGRKAVVHRNYSTFLFYIIVFSMTKITVEKKTIVHLRKDYLNAWSKLVQQVRLQVKYWMC